MGGNTGNLTFTFSPSEDKAYTGTGQLVVTDNKTSKVNLKGSGVYAKAKGALALSIPQPAGTVPGTPAAKFLDFGKVKVGNSGTLPVTIANTDLNNPITVTAAWSNGSQGFAVANPPGNTFAIPKASSLSVNITFTPKAVQKYTDAVTFADAAGNNLCGVVTEGEGTE